MFISEKIAGICENPTDGKTAPIIVQTMDEQERQTISYIKNHGGTIEETGPSNLIKATLPEIAIRDLCEKEFIRAVESPDDSIHLYHED